MNIKKLARAIIVATSAEKEVERLMKPMLKGTEFEHKTFAVGGYVRDEVRGEEAKDLDIVVEMEGGAEKLTKFIYNQLAQPSKVSTPRQLGAGYPIWQIAFKGDVEFMGELYKTDGAVVEFADTMKESFPDENSRQRKTEPGTIQDDIDRRDFTVNSLLKDLSNGEIIDLTGTSKSDIEKGILRGNPNVSFDAVLSADPLRSIRLVRFAVKYDWQIPLSVLKAVKRNAHRITIVSSERIMAELEKVMVLGKLYKAIKLMKLTGLLKYVLPEVEALQGVKQSPNHHAEGDVLKHSLLVLKNAQPTIEGQLAALLHDVGKPKTQQITEDAIHFYGHESVGAEMAEAILYRLKFDKKTIDRVVKLIKEHMRPHQLDSTSSKGLRKLIREMGEELTDALLDLAEADALGSYPIENVIPELREEVRKIKESPIQVKKQPVLSGQEIMDALHIKSGPIVGQAGKFLLELADDYASRGEALTKEKAIEEVKNKF